MSNLIRSLAVSLGLFAESAASRPQEPTAPFPYLSEEVIFVNPSDGVALAGTLTVPDGPGPFPAVVLLHGSAPLDRNEALFGHKPFLVWSDYLTRQEIAVLRFDKRGAGQSGGDYSVATIQDFALDAIAAVDFLKTHPKVQPQQIGLVGHSEGGMTAPLAASKSEDVAFIVLMAGVATPWKELIATQVADLLTADQVPPTTIAVVHGVLNKIYAVLDQKLDQNFTAVALKELLDAEVKKMSEPQSQAFLGTYGPVEKQVDFFNATWFRYYLDYDPGLTLRNVQVPVLALNGDRDLQVSAKENLPLIAKALEEGGNQDYTLVELPQLNHVFQRCGTGAIKEYELIEETIAPQALELLSNWILKKTVRA